MTAKLTDVAKLAGVSSTTVSRVINNHGYLSEKTKAKVRQAMKTLNYQPNSLARSLQGKKTHLIGVIFPEVTNPFFAELVQQIEQELFNQGYKMILCNAGRNIVKERNYINLLIANQVDGIIAGAHNLGIKEYEQLNLPIISFDRKLSDNIPIVACDNYQGIKLAVEALLQDGCQKIAFLGNERPAGNPTDRRLLAYKQTMAEHDLPGKVFSVTYSDSLAIKKMAINKMLATRPDGIVASDDLTALLTINQARELGIKIPDELKITGFDGTEFIQNFLPELTTVVQPIAAIAQMLVKQLIERINHPNNVLAQESILPVSLLKRTSA